jgi:NitT/TauT family transport system permease protein
MRRLEPLLVAAGVVGFFGLWEAMVALGVINARIAPAPSTIAPMVVELLSRGTVLKSLGVTAQEVAVAFVLSIPVGFFIGFTLAEIPGLGAVLRPLVNFLFGVPKSIFLPVFILIFGVGFEQKVAFGVFTTLFVLIMGGIAAVESVPRELITVARAYGANRWQVVREISRSFVQRACRSGSASAARSAVSGNRARCTDSSRGPGRLRHNSSAVTGRIGASSLVRPSAMTYIAV